MAVKESQNKASANSPNVHGSEHGLHRETVADRLATQIIELAVSPKDCTVGYGSELNRSRDDKTVLYVQYLQWGDSLPDNLVTQTGYTKNDRKLSEILLNYLDAERSVSEEGESCPSLRRALGKRENKDRIQIGIKILRILGLELIADELGGGSHPPQQLIWRLMHKTNGHQFDFRNISRQLLEGFLEDEFRRGDSGVLIEWLRNLNEEKWMHPDIATAGFLSFIGSQEIDNFISSAEREAIILKFIPIVEEFKMNLYQVREHNQEDIRSVLFDYARVALLWGRGEYCLGSRKDGREILAELMQYGLYEPMFYDPENPRDVEDVWNKIGETADQAKALFNILNPGTGRINPDVLNRARIPFDRQLDYSKRMVKETENAGYPLPVYVSTIHRERVPRPSPYRLKRLERSQRIVDFLNSLVQADGIN